MTCAIPPLDQAATRVGRGYGEGWNRERTSDDQLHGGMDFVADSGAPVLAPIPGTVVLISDDEGPRISAGAARAGARGQVRRHGGYGNSVVLEHDLDVPGLPRPFWTSYNHLRDPVTLAPGARVIAGDLLGYVGNTTNGQFRGMGAHLHMEVRRMPFPAPVGHDGYELDTVDPSILFASLGIDWIDHHREVGREVGGQLLIREDGPSGPAACGGHGLGRLGYVRRHFDAPASLSGLGTVPAGYVDPSRIRAKYTSKGGSSSSVQVRREVVPPDYGAAVSRAKAPLLGLWAWQWQLLLGLGAAGVVAWGLWRWLR